MESFELPGGMPPDPASISLLCMLSVNYPFSLEYSLERMDLRGQEGLLTP